jgi:serine/threonine protein kinase
MAKPSTPTPSGKIKPGTKKCPKCQLDVATAAVLCPRCETELVKVLKTGEKLAEKYQLIETIGSGGMGVIYKAQNQILNKTVAIKTLHAHLITPESLQRFQREGKAAGNLRHPNIITVYDLGITDQGTAYMVMEFLEGRTLSQILKQDGALNLPAFFHVFLQVCEALAYAHSKGILHRDIKPSNIMITQDKNERLDVRILDFGIAKLIETEQQQSQHLTRTGEAVGSPLYMSPEQAMGANIDFRSDLYSLGCVMYEALCGLTPYEGSSVLQTMMKHLNDAPLPLREISLGSVEVPADVEAIVMKLLAKSPDDRFQSMDEVSKALLLANNNYLALSKDRALPVVAKPKRNKSITFSKERAVYVALSLISTVALVESFIIAANWSKLIRPTEKPTGPTAVKRVEADPRVTVSQTDFDNALALSRGKKTFSTTKFDDAQSQKFANMCAAARAAKTESEQLMLYKHASQIWMKMPDPPTGQIPLQMATDMMALGQPAEFYSICNRLMQKTKDPTLRLPVIGTLGHHYVEVGKLKEAEEIYNQALQDCKGYEPGVAMLNAYLGELELRRQNYKKSEKLLKESIPLLDKYGATLPGYSYQSREAQLWLEECRTENH